MPGIGIIGGSGLCCMDGLALKEERAVLTPYGEPSGPYAIGALSGLDDVEIVFLPRHGKAHNIQPHRINFRANLWGFRELGVERVVSVCAAGGIAPRREPGDIVVLDQVLDQTQGCRAGTYFDAGEVVHIDFTEPYCPQLREALIDASARAGAGALASGTYICVNGPRLESRAEIRHFAAMGADVVGMTGMPEAALARELEMCYASVAVVTNRAAGFSGQKLTVDEVVGSMKAATGRLKAMIGAFLPLVPAERGCPCKDALKGARM